MKIFNKYTFIMILAGIFTMSCEDEELKEKNFPGWESGVNGFAQFQEASPKNFTRGQPAQGLDMDFRWISIDGTNEVVKIEYYVEFSESYINPQGDPAVADHGKELVLTVDSPAGNREDISLSLDQNDLLPLFQGKTYDYDENESTAETPVFNNPDKPNRGGSSPFLDGDSFKLTWVLTTADGRVFDSWSPSVCTELPGSNCELGWIVICASEIADPPGDYTIVFNDSYGDGWNDAAIRVVVDGVATDYTLDAGSTGTTVVTVPPGTQTLTFEFVSGDWDSEVTFTITSPKGNVIASGGPSPTEGELTLDLCKE